MTFDCCNNLSQFLTVLCVCIVQLRREISELAVLEAFIQSLPISHPAAAAATGPASSKSSAVGAVDAELRDKHKMAADGGAAVGQAQVEDKSVLRMKSAINTMLGNLKVKINTTEKVLGDKLKVLDKDGDGQISFDEIKDVIGSVMKRGASTEESVEQLFSLLDSNKDGKVSVAELLHYIHKKRETMEVEAAEVRMYCTSAVFRVYCLPYSYVQNCVV